MSDYLKSAKGETGINSVSCGAACFQMKNPAGGDGAWCYKRMCMLEISFSGFCHFCYSPSSPSEPICTAVASSWQIDYVNEDCRERRGPRRTGNWARELYEGDRQKFCAVPEAVPESQCLAELAFPLPSWVASTLKGEESLFTVHIWIFIFLNSFMYFKIYSCDGKA